MRPWLHAAGATFRTLVDRHNEVGKAYGLKYVPVAIIVDATGHLVRAVQAVDIGDDDFRSQLESWARDGRIPAAWLAGEAAAPRELTLAEREADARFQLALVLLDRGDQEQALEQLRLAVRQDPENWLIRKQMWAIETPEAFYEGSVDYGWQAEQRQREAETFLKE